MMVLQFQEVVVKQVRATIKWMMILEDQVRSLELECLKRGPLNLLVLEEVEMLDLLIHNLRGNRAQ